MNPRPWTELFVLELEDIMQAHRVLHVSAPDGYDQMSVLYSRWGFVELLSKPEEILISAHDKGVRDSLSRALSGSYPVARMGLDLIVQRPLLAAGATENILPKERVA